VIAHVKVGGSGRFQVALPPGRYVIQAESETGFDEVDVPVTVHPGRVASVRVTFNSGIG
jgi:hypothetical protein